MQKDEGECRLWGSSAEGTRTREWGFALGLLATQPCCRHCAGAERALIRERGTEQVMQVHDEIIIEARAQVLPEVVADVRRCLHGAASLIVPLKTKVRCGPSWGALSTVADLG